MTKGHIRTSDAEIREHVRRAREHEKYRTRILDARYSRSQDALVARLSSGSTLTIPRARIPGFEKLGPADLRRPAIEPPGNGIWFYEPDTGVLLETLVIAAAGEETIRDAAFSLLGSRTSEKKARSSAANGRLGGRPPKKKQPHRSA